MGALIGFIFGYVVGAKAGPEGYERLREAWQTISESDEWKGLVATATAFVQNAVTEGGEGIVQRLEETVAGHGEVGEAWRKLTGDGDLARAWSAISESDAVQEVLSGGIALLGNVLEQGRSAFEKSGVPGRA
jgi:hypothetical protein